MRRIMIWADQGGLKAHLCQTSPRTMDSPLCQISLQDHFLSARCTSWHKVLAGVIADADVLTAALAESVFLPRSKGWRKHGLSCPYFVDR